jgi:hypothetical protein
LQTVTQKIQESRQLSQLIRTKRGQPTHRFELTGDMWQAIMKDGAVIRVRNAGQGSRPWQAWRVKDAQSDGMGQTSRFQTMGNAAKAALKYWNY